MTTRRLNSSLLWIILPCLIAILAGLLYPIIHIEIGIILTVIFTALLIFVFLKNKFDILLLISLWSFFFAQFRLPIFEIGRFASLFMIAVLSAYLAKDWTRRKNKVILGLSLVAVYTLATSLFSSQPLVVTQKSLSLFLLISFVYFVPCAINQFHPTQQVLDYILQFFLITAYIFVISNAIFFLLNPTSSNSYFSRTALLDGRFRGWFINPNDLATFLGIFFVPLLWFRLRKLRPSIDRLGLILVFLLSAVELWGTQSRAGILACFIALYLMEIGAKKWGGRFQLSSFLALCLLVIYFMNPEGNIIKQFIYRNEIELAGSGRLDYWRAAMIRFQQDPIIGSGLGVSNMKSLPYSEGFVYSSRGFTLQKDNSYITMLEELGIVGFSLICIFLVSPLVRTGVNKFQIVSQNGLNTNLVSISILAAGLFNAIFESWLLAVGNLACILFWLLASIWLDSTNITIESLSKHV